MNILNYIKDIQSKRPSTAATSALWQAYIRLALILVLVITILILFPFAIIWAFNVLFKTGIEYDFTSWCAVIVLYIALKAHAPVDRRPKIKL